MHRAAGADGLVIIGGEGAVVLGGLAAIVGGPAARRPRRAAIVVQVAMASPAWPPAARWIGLAGALRHWRGVNETISTLVLSYIAIAVLNHLVEGPMRDPASLNKPSTRPLPDADMIGNMPGMDVHRGLALGLVACVLAWLLMYRTTFGFAARIVGGNRARGRIAGLPVGRMIVIVTALGGAAAGLAGMIEVAAVQGRANATSPPAMALPASSSPSSPANIRSRSCRWRSCSAASARAAACCSAASICPTPRCWCCKASSSSRSSPARACPPLQRLESEDRPMTAGSLGLWTVPIAVLGGAIRVSTPFLFVSLGECLTEKSGRINLGNEGTLVIGAMIGYGIAYLTGTPWLGVLAAGVAGMALGALHAGVCSLPRVNDIAIGIAMMLSGTGLAFYLGKPLVQPSAPTLPALPLGFWSDIPQVRAALEVNALFFVGLVMTPLLRWALRQHPLGADRAHRRRFSRGRARARLFADRRAPLRDLLRRLPGRHRRRVPVALLSGQLERRPVVRPGPDGGRAGDLRALEPDRPASTPRCCSAAPARSARRCRRSASPRATTCSTPRPMS